jgi:hypothetical protein
MSSTDVTPVPVEVIETAVKTVIDFTDKSQLVQFVMKTVAEVETDLKLSDEEKAQKVVSLVRQAISSAGLPEDKKAELLIWCNMALPYLIEAIGIVKSEISKVGAVVVADLQKCCPSLASVFKSA